MRRSLYSIFEIPHSFLYWYYFQHGKQIILVDKRDQQTGNKEII